MNYAYFLAISKSDSENMETGTEGCVLDIHFGGETHFDLRCVANKCQSLIITGWDCFGCQVTATLWVDRLERMGSDSHFSGRSLVFHCQLQLSGIWIENGALTNTLNAGLHLTAVDNPSFGLNTQSSKQPNTSWGCLKKQLKILVSLITRHCCLNKHLHKMTLTTSPVCTSCQLEKETAIHFVCVSVRLLLHWEHAFLASLLEFTEASASAILRFAFQSGRLEANLWHNSQILQNVTVFVESLPKYTLI
jgi:hypothetical protein